MVLPGAIRLKYIYVYDESTNTWPSSPMTISSSSSVWNQGVSIITMPSGPMVAWKTDDSGTFDPWHTKAALKDPYSRVYRFFDYHVKSVSLNKLNDNSKYCLAWSEIYNQTGWTDHNIYVSSDNFSSYHYLYTNRWYLQLKNGDDASQMKASTYYRPTSTREFVESNAFGGTLSAMAPAAENMESGSQSPSVYTGRGAVIGKGNAGVQYSIYHVQAGSQLVDFIPVADTLRFQNVDELNNVLITKPFILQKGQNVRYVEEIGFGDSTSVNQLFAKGSMVRYRVDLVDASSGQILEAVRNHVLNASHPPVRESGTDSILTGIFAGRRVQ